MTSVELNWLRAEAAHQGLPLTDDDLRAIQQLLERTKAALAAARPEDTDRLEPAYEFAPRRSRSRTRNEK